MKTITLNGTQQQTSANTLADLFASLQSNTGQCAAAVNHTFIPRSQYATTTLSDGDHIELLTPMQGG